MITTIQIVNSKIAMQSVVNTTYVIPKPNRGFGIAVNVRFVIDDTDDISDDQGHHEMLMHPNPVALQ